MREFHYHEETVQLICIVPLLFACGLKDKIEKLQIIPNGGEFNRKSDCPARPKRMGGYWRQNSGNTKAQDMDQNEPPPPRSTGYRVLNITNIDTLRVSFFCCCLIIPLTYLPRGEEPKIGPDWNWIWTWMCLCLVWSGQSTGFILGDFLVVVEPIWLIVGFCV